jgi:hypothetical protein
MTQLKVDQNTGTTIIDEQNQLIAMMGYLSLSKTEAVAYANLFAAAPEMLAVLKAFVDYRDRVGALGFQLEKADDYINNMRTIISIAEGE